MADRDSIGTDDTVATGSPQPVEVADTLLPSGESMLAGRYELIGLLGAGGMGAVYSARDRELSEVVALKMLRPELTNDASALERFRQEVRLARRVTHKNVARTFDIGEHRGMRFLTMEHIDGESLAARLAERGALPVADVVELAGAVCAGLSAAHAVGVVHRDLKPENVMVACDRRVVVTDFGIAYARAPGGEAEHAIVGTPAYMAPEQFRAHEPVDLRADLYALGAVLFELLTGAKAWKADGPMKVLSVRAAARTTPDPRSSRPSVSDAFAAVVMRCMAHDPTDRFRDADEVVRELSAALRVESKEGDRAGAASVARDRLLGSAPRALVASKTVAVLPLRNAGPPDDDYIGDALTDELIDTLSMTSGLRVRPRSIVARFKGKPEAPDVVGRELGVQVVVEGSLRRIASAVRFEVRLIGAADGFQLWAKRFDTSLSDLLVASGEAARAIADALSVDLPSVAVAAVADPVAMELYLRAKQEYWRSWHATAAGAASLFDRALALAPSDTKILAGCAMAYARMVFWGEGTREETLARARALTDAAVIVAPEYGDAWAAAASFRLNTGDPVGAARALHTGLTRAPNFAFLQDMLGRLLAEVGAIDEAVLRLRIALELDPTLISAHQDLARIYAMEGDWLEVDRQLDAISPTEPSLARDVMRARLALWRRSTPPIPVTEPNTFLRLYVDVSSTGRLDTQHRELMTARADGASARLRPLFFQRNAEVYAFVQDRDSACGAIHKAIDSGLIDLQWLDRCPLFTELRTDVRWPALREEVATRAADVLKAVGR
jgi:serine/threonine-protein kinase